MKTFPFAIASWERDTAHMGPLAIGAYVTLLCHIYDVEDALLPTSLEAIRRLARIDPEDWFAVWEELEPAFKKTPQGYLQKHADRFIHKKEAYNKRRSEDGKVGAVKRWKGHKKNSPPDRVGNRVGHGVGHRVPNSSIEIDKKEGGAQKRKHPIPNPFNLTQDLATYWQEKVNWKSVEEGLEAFRDYHLRQGSKFSDWAAAWRQWTRNEVKFHNDRQETGGMAI